MSVILASLEPDILQARRMTHVNDPSTLTFNASLFMTAWARSNTTLSDSGIWKYTLADGSLMPVVSGSFSSLEHAEQLYKTMATRQAMSSAYRRYRRDALPAEPTCNGDDTHEVDRADTYPLTTVIHIYFISQNRLIRTCSGTMGALICVILTPTLTPSSR